MRSRTLAVGLVMFIAGVLVARLTPLILTPTTDQPAATADFVVLSVAADPGACTPDYAHGAWDICGVIFPSSAEDEFELTYFDGAWHLELTPDFPNGK